MEEHPKSDSQHEIQCVGITQIDQKPSRQRARVQLLLFTRDTYSHPYPD